MALSFLRFKDYRIKRLWNFSAQKMSGHFRSTTWDPLLIIFQIISMQCIMYVGLGFWMIIVDFLVGSFHSLDHFFKYDEIHVRDFGGKLAISAFFLNALSCALGLWCVVQRTKQCLDFTCTAHFIHLLACWYYNGYFPSTLSWWLLNIACLTVMCVLAEFMCMKTELQAIPVNLGPKSDL